MTGNCDDPPREVTVQLLDPVYGWPIKTWKFTDRSSLTIGRGDGLDIEISDAYVSRLHAELLFRDGQWTLVSRGRNGVMVGSRQITELTIVSEVKFRLGSTGPSLRFNTADISTTENTEANSGTLSYAADTSPLLVLDETKLREDVAQISSDDYFQKLQKKVKELRHQHRVL